MKPLRPSSPLLAVAMIRDPGFLSWDTFDNSCLKAARDTQPYRVGDMIRWLDLDRHGQRVLRAGLVVHVRPGICGFGRVRWSAARPWRLSWTRLFK